MNKSTLILMGLLCLSLNANAKNVEAQSLGFAAPIVPSDDIFANEPAGTLIYDNAAQAFKGLDPSGNSVVLGVTPGATSQAFALKSKQTYNLSNCTGGSGNECTWTKPTDVTAILVEVVGGGGGGGGGGSKSTGAGERAAGTGGGGGGYCRRFITSGLQNTPVTVGVAGTVTAGNDGGTGGTSSFGSLCIATGGTGGQSSNASSGSGNLEGQPGGMGSNGDLNMGGQGSNGGIRSGAVSLALGSAGGNSFYGGGGYGGSGDDQGGAAFGFGGGGGGSASGEVVVPRAESRCPQKPEARLALVWSLFGNT